MPRELIGDSWWRRRRHFLARSFLSGFGAYGKAFAVISILVPVTVLGALAWAAHQPGLGAEIAFFLLALIVLEGACRLWYSEKNEAERLRSDLDDYRHPRLAIRVQEEHFNAFEDGSGQGKYATIKVSTTEPVKACRGHMAKIIRGQTEVPVRAPIPLRWLGTNDLAVDLAPGLDREMLVAFTQSTTPGEIFIGTDSHEPRGLPWSLGEGANLVTVVVTAEKVPRAEVELRVRAHGDWRRLHMTRSDEALAEDFTPYAEIQYAPSPTPDGTSGGTVSFRDGPPQ